MVVVRSELSYRTSFRDIAAGMLTTFEGENSLARNLFEHARKLVEEFESLKLIRRITGRIVEPSAPDY